MLPRDLAQKMRASFLIVGPLLARFGHAQAPHPGGCAIGTRPVSVDLKGFQTMGAEVDTDDLDALDRPGAGCAGEWTSVQL